MRGLLCPLVLFHRKFLRISHETKMLRKYAQSAFFLLKMSAKQTCREDLVEVEDGYFGDSKCRKSKKMTHIVEKDAYTQDGFTGRISVVTGTVKVLNSSKK